MTLEHVEQSIRMVGFALFLAAAIAVVMWLALSRFRVGPDGTSYTLRETVAYWLADNGAPYARAEYQINKAGHALLITLTLVGIGKIADVEIPAIPLAIAVVLIYWSADWWLPSADHRHVSEHPVIHYTAKLMAGMLAPVLLASFDHPWWLVGWFALYLPVLMLRL